MLEFLDFHLTSNLLFLHSEWATILYSIYLVFWILARSR